MKFEDYEQVVRGLIRDMETRNSRFLVGAGVSMLYPCSLPSGAELKDLALFEFLKHSELEGLIEKIRNHWKYGSIVPEVIFQRLYEALRENLYPFFNVLNFGNSNLGHEVIAHIIDISGINVFTTNFDMLIEKHVVTDIDRVIHLHGSLGDHSQMMVRINQVGRGLDSSLKNSIKSELDGKNLYVLGYSGNDKDIVDTLNSCRPEKIIWLVRSRKDDFVISNIKRLNQNVKLRVTEGDLTDLFGNRSEVDAGIFSASAHFGRDILETI